MSSEMIAPDLPPYSLDVQSMDLGDDTKAVGLELLETESREPLRGPVAAQIWSAAFPPLAAKESLVVDFFSHLERVREFCKLHGVVFRETASRCLVLTQPSQEQLRLVFERFEKETFGMRVRSPRQSRRMRSWRMNCRIAGSTHTRRLTLAIHFARSANRRTAG